jgi:hypothetical protein
LNERWLANKKNGTDQREGWPATAAGRSAEVVDRYEELRQQALGEMGRGLGMVLFLREGMKAWMEAWANATLQLPQRPPSSPAAGLTLPQGAREEAILVLAEMALRVQSEVNRW